MSLKDEIKEIEKANSKLDNFLCIGKVARELTGLEFFCTICGIYIKDDAIVKITKKSILCGPCLDKK